MGSPAVGALRLLRCSAFGVPAGGWAVTAHLVAGGATPDPRAAALVAGICALSGWLLAGRRRHWPTLLVVLAAVQVSLHVTLELEMELVTAPPATGHGSHPMAVAPAGWVPSAGMLAAHVVAVLATGLALAHGEQGLWHLLSWLRALPELPVPVQLAPAPARLPVRTQAVRAFRPAGPGRGLCRRGPPVRERLSPAA